MLSGKKIKQAIDIGAISCYPKPMEMQYQPHSIDLRLGGYLSEVVPNSPDGYIDTHKPGAVKPVKMVGDGYILMPGTLYLGHTLEAVGSKGYAGVLHGRSTAGRHGIMVHVTAGFIDAGWSGQIVLELVNVTPYPIKIYPGDRICQVEFDKIEGEVELYSSDYQGQLGIRPAKSMADAPF